MSDDSSRTWTVEIAVPEDSEMDEAGETFEFEVGEDEYVLASVRSQGLWLPADCQQGWCITCAARLEEGEVDVSDAKRYYDSDRDAGYVLTCVTKPRSDLRLVVDKYGELLRVRAQNDKPPGRSKLD